MYVYILYSGKKFMEKYFTISCSNKHFAICALILTTLRINFRELDQIMNNGKFNHAKISRYTVCSQDLYNIQDN